MQSIEDSDKPTLGERARRRIIGPPKTIRDPSLFHKLSLIPLLAWVGLGADGLSSSAYGPEEAFRTLGEHRYIALILAVMTIVTVLIISWSYSRIIEHFPHGGGGYIVASRMLGPKVGVVSGAALLVDYVLTITVSVVACTDAVFSYLPLEFGHHKVLATCILLIGLTVLNMRGAKESITILAPIFIVFVITHVVMLFDGVFTNARVVAPVIENARSVLHNDMASIGFIGILALTLRAYSLGGGTYTGIEAVSNGLQILREPRVQNGKRTMVYMATSLAFTASMLFVCYLLLDVRPAPGRTLNSVLADALFADWPFGGVVAAVTIFSEGALLLVAAQAGFVDGPRVMANMATDSWFPHRFAAVSDRLTMENGILMMGIAAIILTIYTHGSVSALIVLYSINVFLTFSLSQLGMTKYFVTQRTQMTNWLRRASVHIIGLLFCVTILMVTTYEKFSEGGWLTLLITSVVVAACITVHHHYSRVRDSVRKLDEELLDLPLDDAACDLPVDRKAPTAIQLVSGYSGFGVHTTMMIARSFPGLYKNFVFVSVAVVDASAMKGSDELAALENRVKGDLEKYVELARKLGFAAEYRFEIATEVVESAVTTCRALAREFGHSTVFSGQVTFRTPRIWEALLHNQTSVSIQRQLHWSGITTVIMPVRIGL